MNRRTTLKQLSLALPALAMSRAGAAGPTDMQAAAIAGLAEKFMAGFSVPGLSVAFANRDAVVFRAAYGVADESTGLKLTADHVFRIASISKPLTAVAIFRLIEQGKLKASDRVFGPGGILEAGTDLPPRVAEVTVHHLLTHTAGGWGNEQRDPMFGHPELDHAGLIARTLREHPLRNDPGTAYAYSNFGYCLLGRIVEKLTSRSYEDHVRESLLGRCGIRTMKLAGNTRAERADGEVVYHGRQGEDPYAMNVRRMDAHGGWLARPEDLVNFLRRVDGELLEKPTVKTMLQATGANAGYASGWAVNAAPNRWHGGSLPGTATIAVTTARGMSWAGFANARSPGISPALDRLMWEMAKAVPEWRA
jgi:CubicO group peptidase (beta-lactamase class C family)